MLRSNVAFFGWGGFWLIKDWKIGNVLKMYSFKYENSLPSCSLWFLVFFPRYTKVNRDNDTWTHQLELGWVKMTNLLPNSIYKVCINWLSIPVFIRLSFCFSNITLVLHVHVFICLVGCTCSPGARQGEWSQTDGSQDHMQWATTR